MKNLFKLPVFMLYIIVSISCTTDSSSEPQGPVFSGGNPGVIDSRDFLRIYFGFLDGEGSSNTYIDMPIESSSTNLVVGRWKITKLGIDHNNDGYIEYYNYQDFNHKDCGLSFLQFNNNGVVFENIFYKDYDDGSCILYSETADWELVEADRFKIYVYNNIYLVNVTQSELILKYDWNFENSLYGPAQVYYYYERIQASV